jgi:hypothetical protein
MGTIPESLPNTTISEAFLHATHLIISNNQYNLIVGMITTLKTEQESDRQLALMISQ